MKDTDAVAAFRPEPFVALMRRYCIDYTNSHDLSVCDEIMSDDYAVHSAGNVLRGRDVYKAVIARTNQDTPTSAMVVHDIVTNGQSLALRSTGHCASLRHGRRTACWATIAIYRWDGRVLLQNSVEQDLYSKQAQLNGRPFELEPPALDPWLTTVAEPSDPSTDERVHRWLECLSFSDEDAIFDAGHGPQPRFEIARVGFDDFFSAGPRAGFHLAIHGTYRGGLPGLEHAEGTSTTHYVAGIADVSHGRVRASLVTDRSGLERRLRRSDESAQPQEQR